MFHSFEFKFIINIMISKSGAGLRLKLIFNLFSFVFSFFLKFWKARSDCYLWFECSLDQV